MPRGGKRKGAGQPKKYTDPVEIRIRLNRQDRDRITQFCKDNGISDRNNWLKNQLLLLIKA